MHTIAVISLSGGQGKTTLSWLLGKSLAVAGYRTLLVDGDPQANLTLYSGTTLSLEDPSLLEVIKKETDISNAVYPTRYENLSIIPTDDGLHGAMEYLSAKGMGALILGSRLSSLDKDFDFCIIDSPPQRSQMSLTAAGAAASIVIPAEATAKGVGSLNRTLETLAELQELGALKGRVLGCVPFRDKWVGLTQTRDSRDSIQVIRAICHEYGLNIYPSMLESQQFKKAVYEGKTLTEIGRPELEMPIGKVIEEIAA